uniref:Uncharacterized protein n=1 Tax=Theropithecus gelada TaxID=9565 RepID=A0A8D2EYT3_THEGE
MYYSPEKKILRGPFIYGYSFIYSLKIPKVMLQPLNLPYFVSVLLICCCLKKKCFFSIDEARP